MAKPLQPDQDLIQKWKLDQDRLFKAVASSDTKLKKIYKDLGKNLRAAFKSRAKTQSIKSLITKAFAASFRTRLKILAENIEPSAKKGIESTDKLIAKVLGSKDVKIGTSAKSVELASEQIAKGVQASRKVPLSKRIRKWDETITERMTVEVQKNIQTSQGILKAANEIKKIDANALRTQLPAKLEEIVKIARKSPRSRELKKAIQKYKETTLKELGMFDPELGGKASGAYTIRGPTNRFLSQVSKASEAELDSIVETWIDKRATYQARLIARTETVEAFRNASIKQAENKPYIVAQKWNLAKRHPEPDECDIYANQDLYGWGPGIYPKDKPLPERHPNCICYMTPVFDDKWRARRRGELPPVDEEFADPKRIKTGEQYLKDLPEDKARALIGPRKLVLLKQGRKVLSDQGKPLSLSEIGEKKSARERIRDRAKAARKK